MIILLYNKSIEQNDNCHINLNSISIVNRNDKANKYIEHKKYLIFIIFIFSVILFENNNLESISNDVILSKKKKYHYFSKYFKQNSYIKNNNTKAKKISLVNEIIYLHNIRKQINKYKNINFENIHFKKFSKVSHPKISLILTVYNQEIYILKIYSCILNQSLTDIEIIFIDDKSSDGSLALIEKLMIFDKRIILIKNKSNKGQFYSRNAAVMQSSGKYILIIDPDDFLLNNILIKCYKAAIVYKLDITQFYHIMGNYSKNHLYILNQNSRPIQKPLIKTIFFNNPTRYLWDKLIKKEIFIKSIYFMHIKYRNERFIIHNDDTACFGIFKVANSYGQLEDIGYFYNRNVTNSTTSKNFIPENINGRFHCIFTIMKYYFEQSSSPYEKIYGGYKFFTYRIIRKYNNKIQFLTNGFEYIIDVIDMYLKYPYFSKDQKLLLKLFKTKIIKQKLNINN